MRVPRKVSVLGILLGLACIQLAGMPHPHHVFRSAVFAAGFIVAGVGIGLLLYPRGKQS
jgi:hypothetical protein